MFTGEPGPGRPKGVRSKANVAPKRVEELFRELNFDPLRELVKLYQDPDTPIRTKYEIGKELASYAYPKRRSVEVKSEHTNRNLNISWDVPPPVQAIDAETVESSVALSVDPHVHHDVNDDSTDD